MHYYRGHNASSQCVDILYAHSTTLLTEQTWDLAQRFLQPLMQALINELNYDFTLLLMVYRVYEGAACKKGGQTSKCRMSVSHQACRRKHMQDVATVKVAFQEKTLHYSTACCKRTINSLSSSFSLSLILFLGTATSWQPVADD